MLGFSSGRRRGATWTRVVTVSLVELVDAVLSLSKQTAISRPAAFYFAGHARGGGWRSERGRLQEPGSVVPGSVALGAVVLGAVVVGMVVGRSCSVTMTRTTGLHDLGQVLTPSRHPGERRVGTLRAGLPGQ